MVREWRHVKVLKRTGRGHEPGGADATTAGELALQCPACPQPGVNLPDDWKDAPDDIKCVHPARNVYCTNLLLVRRYIYTLIIAVDANFRLKRRAISNDQRDPALGSGSGYFVEDQRYREHILSYANEEDVSKFCSTSLFTLMSTLDQHMYRICGNCASELEVFKRLCSHRRGNGCVRSPRLHHAEWSWGSAKGGTVCFKISCFTPCLFYL